MAWLALWVKPKRMEATPAMQKNRVMERRGPQESESSPAGSCLKA